MAYIDISLLRTSCAVPTMVGGVDLGRGWDWDCIPPPALVGLLRRRDVALGDRDSLPPSLSLLPPVAFLGLGVSWYAPALLLRLRVIPAPAPASTFVGE